MEKENPQTTELRRRLIAGEPIETIAEALGLSLSSVKSRIHRAGMFQRLPPQARTTLIDRMKKGWTASRIARQINLDAELVEHEIQKIKGKNQK